MSLLEETMTLMSSSMLSRATESTSNASTFTIKSIRSPSRKSTKLPRSLLMLVFQFIWSLDLIFYFRRFGRRWQWLEFIPKEEEKDQISMSPLSWPQEEEVSILRPPLLKFIGPCLMISLQLSSGARAANFHQWGVDFSISSVTRMCFRFSKRSLKPETWWRAQWPKRLIE